jgi:hypothetical protein
MSNKTSGTSSGGDVHEQGNRTIAWRGFNGIASSPKARPDYQSSLHRDQRYAVEFKDKTTAINQHRLYLPQSSGLGMVLSQHDPG